MTQEPPVGDTNAREPAPPPELEEFSSRAAFGNTSRGAKLFEPADFVALMHNRVILGGLGVLVVLLLVMLVLVVFGGGDGGPGRAVSVAGDATPEAAATEMRSSGLVGTVRTTTP